MADQASIKKMRVAFEPGVDSGSGDGARLEGGMEHRLGTRMPISLPVKLHHPGKTPALGRMTNVSLSGAYVQTSVDLEPLACIEIGWKQLVPEPAAVEPAAVPCVAAFVTRVAADGVALEWLEFAPAVIRQLMRRGQPAATRRPAACAAAAMASTA